MLHILVIYMTQTASAVQYQKLVKNKNSSRSSSSCSTSTNTISISTILLQLPPLLVVLVLFNHATFGVLAWQTAASDWCRASKHWHSTARHQSYTAFIAFFILILYIPHSLIHYSWIHVISSVFQCCWFGEAIRCLDCRNSTAVITVLLYEERPNIIMVSSETIWYDWYNQH